MENSYGIGIANRYDLFYGQDDVTDFETVVSKKKKEKKEPAVAVVGGAVKTAAGAEKENKAKTPATTTGNAQPAKQEPRKDQRKGIKEQNNTRKDNGEFSKLFFRFFALFEVFSQKMCSHPPHYEAMNVLVRLCLSVLVGK
jgi:hypothetical protein